MDIQDLLLLDTYSHLESMEPDSIWKECESPIDFSFKQSDFDLDSPIDFLSHNECTLFPKDPNSYSLDSFGYPSPDLLDSSLVSSSLILMELKEDSFSLDDTTPSLISDVSTKESFDSFSSSSSKDQNAKPCMKTKSRLRSNTISYHCITPLSPFAVGLPNESMLSVPDFILPEPMKNPDPVVCSTSDPLLLNEPVLEMDPILNIFGDTFGKEECIHQPSLDGDLADKPSKTKFDHILCQPKTMKSARGRPRIHKCSMEYICSFCKSTFVRKHDLKRHSERFHPDEELISARRNTF